MKEIVRAGARITARWCVHDFAYADLGFDGYKPPSILQVQGAKEVAVEIFSMSKSYNMAGWRVGFCLGNPKMIAALARIKSYLDYGVFQPIQIASIIALRECEEDTKKICALYQKRRDVLVTGLETRRLAGGEAEGLDVRVGADSGEVPRDGLAGILQAAAREGAGRRFAGDRLRTAGRRLRALRADRERPANPPGSSLDQAVPEAVKLILRILLLLPMPFARLALRAGELCGRCRQCVPPGTNDTRALQPVIPIGGGRLSRRYRRVRSRDISRGRTDACWGSQQGGPPPAPGSSHP